MTAADEVPDPEGFRLAGISRVSAPGIGGWTGGSDEVPVVCWVVELGRDPILDCMIPTKL